MQVQNGARGEARLIVEMADTAIGQGSGDVPVLGTPRVVALCEAAALAALTGCCAEDETTVGMRVQLDHLRPTRIGAEVVAEAVLEKIEGRRLTFTILVNDPGGLVAAAKLVRVAVLREHFLEKAGIPADHG